MRRAPLKLPTTILSAVDGEESDRLGGFALALAPTEAVRFVIDVCDAKTSASEAFLASRTCRPPFARLEERHGVERAFLRSLVWSYPGFVVQKEFPECTGFTSQAIRPQSPT